MIPVRLVLLACAVGLTLAGSALADHQEPQQRITAADQARGRAMLVKRSDLTAGFRQQAPSNEPDPHIDCPPSVSEADLTQTGDVEGPGFTRGIVTLSSAAQLYESVADASASWRRGTSAAGIECLRNLARREFATGDLRFVSLRKISFTRVAQRTVAFRIVFSGKAQQQTIKVYGDIVVLMHSRAHAQVTAISALQPFPRVDLVALARVVSGRMARAMRGG
jgi:hypothetical protein